MPLESIGSLMRRAVHGGYAVDYFESWNIESLQGVIDALQAALELAASGIDCEVIDVRSLAPIDYATIGKSVEKTGRVVIVEEGPKTGGVSGAIAAGLMEHCGESLISPVGRVASADLTVPFTPVLENAYRPEPSRIVAAVRELVR